METEIKELFFNQIRNLTFRTTNTQLDQFLAFSR